jgi:hypothetical protein
MYCLCMEHFENLSRAYVRVYHILFIARPLNSPLMYDVAYSYSTLYDMVRSDNNLKIGISCLLSLYLFNNRLVNTDIISILSKTLMWYKMSGDHDEQTIVFSVWLSF